ncbi:MAG TPA: class I SAM-dependent methyltransferase, partial [Gammaproteobacteria bacterium]|nr:class I SAM-dependent methyltransferase [Gammaproteobacteria bacterium]
PFVDRSFGHHLEPTTAWDSGFIDRLHGVDEAGFKSGDLTPNMMFAAMTTNKSDKEIFVRGLSPEKSIRPVADK